MYQREAGEVFRVKQGRASLPVLKKEMIIAELIRIPFSLNRHYPGQFGAFKLIAASISYKNTLVCCSSQQIGTLFINADISHTNRMESVKLSSPELLYHSSSIRVNAFWQNCRCKKQGHQRPPKTAPFLLRHVRLPWAEYVCRLTLGKKRFIIKLQFKNKDIGGKRERKEKHMGFLNNLFDKAKEQIGDSVAEKVKDVISDNLDDLAAKIPEDKRDEILKLLEAGKKVAAIQKVCDITGLNKAEAEKMLEKLKGYLK